MMPGITQHEKEHFLLIFSQIQQTINHTMSVKDADEQTSRLVFQLSFAP